MVRVREGEAMIRRIAMSGLLAATLGCHINKAPADVNQIQPWFWDNYSSGADSDIANAVTRYDGLGTINTVSAKAGMPSWTGTLSVKLTTDDLAVVGMKGTDPSTAAPGLLVVTDMPCTLAQIEPLLYRQDQDKIHSGQYDSYARTYTSSLDDFTSGKSETITWTSTYKPNGLPYTATVSGGLRLIPDLGKSTSPFGPVLLARTWLPQPATFSVNGQYFKQDYQMEVYWERTPGHTIHSFADWRDISVYEGPLGPFTASNNTYQTFVLSNDVNWDTATAKQCGG
jgi:hypothetical protein